MKLLYLQILIKNCKNIIISFFFNIISYKIFVIRKIIKKTIIKKDILYDIIFPVPIETKDLIIPTSYG